MRRRKDEKLAGFDRRTEISRRKIAVKYRLQTRSKKKTPLLWAMLFWGNCCGKQFGIINPNFKVNWKFVIFGLPRCKASGAFARKFSPKAAKPANFLRTYAPSGLQRKPTLQADGEFFSIKSKLGVSSSHKVHVSRYIKRKLWTALLSAILSLTNVR